MPTLRGKVSRQQFPSGQDGQVLVLDTSSPHGIAWRSGIDRLITDITPELSGDLDCNSFDLTSVGSIGFSAVTGTLAGIQNQNLLDKTAAESISGIYTHNANIVMADNSITGLDTLTFTTGAGTIAGVQNQNLVDKSAGAFTADLAMGTNQITGLGAPGASTDAATRGYVDTAVGAAPLDRAFWHGYKTLAHHTLTGLTKGADNWVTTPPSWTVQEAEEWSESSGEWSYAGDFPASGKRYFRVSYHFAIDGYASANWWRMQGRVTHTPDGGAAAVVPGSIMSSTPYAFYAIFGVSIQHHHVSGSCIVEMAHEDDTLSFQYGNYVTGAGTFTAGNLITRDSGLSLTITPADINP
jgi:hypothetical protein